MKEGADLNLAANLILASKSPRRRELMQLVTPNFTCAVAGIDETAVSAPSPRLLAQQLAIVKADAIFALHPHQAVIGCDTVVDLEGKALGKPLDKEDAIAMLTALSGKEHLVHTGVCIQGNFTPVSFIETTKVYFAPIPIEEITRYADTNEPYDKAGGYGIQGTAARFIPRISGCYYNVMGLPVASLYCALKKLNLL